MKAILTAILVMTVFYSIIIFMAIKSRKKDESN